MEVRQNLITVEYFGEPGGHVEREAECECHDIEFMPTLNNTFTTSRARLAGFDIRALRRALVRVENAPGVLNLCPNTRSSCNMF
jgi:hypothetical protein